MTTTEIPVDNGVNVEALLGVRDALTDTPEVAQFQWRSTVSWVSRSARPVWLDVPVVDRRGRVVHNGGVTASPGLYVIGMPFLRRRKSSFIDGAREDAQDLIVELAAFLDRQAR